MLANYKAETRVIPLGDSAITVLGLSLNSFTQLITAHFDDLEAVYDLISSVTKGKADISEQDIATIIGKALSEAPGLVANLICAAANETGDDAHNAALTIPFPKQFEIATAVIDMTFKEVGGVKKSIDQVMSLMKTMKSPLLTNTES